MPAAVVYAFANGALVRVPVELISAGERASEAYAQASMSGGCTLLLRGDRDYTVVVPGANAGQIAALRAREGRSVYLGFPGRGVVRRILAKIAVNDGAPPAEEPTAPVTVGRGLDLTEGREGAAPLWLLPDGSFSVLADSAGAGFERHKALVNAARWISGRRKTSFERLFAPSAFHPDQAARTEALTVTQARGLLAQLSTAMKEAAVGGAAALADASAAAQIRSACATVYSHLIATSLRDPGFRAAADEATRALFTLIDAEQGHASARPALRAHAVGLLQMRAPALSDSDRARARTLVQSLVRAAPPYAELKGPWNFAICSADEFHDGECDILLEKYRFREIEKPADTPAPPSSWHAYRVFEAPFSNVHGEPIRLFARSAQPTDENHEMGQPFFVGLLINRHAQLGSFDMRAANSRVQQRGYKLMINSQCAGLTTRFAIGRVFPDADIYSSWDSTYFRKDFEGRKVIASEGLDCFFALLQGMSKGESHASIDQRMRRVQWRHPQANAVPNFSQFVGPANPLVIGRYSDVNQDGRADFYDGFLDFDLASIAEDINAAMTPRDPGVKATQVSGEAANGLGWAAGSMNRVTQYSDIWAGLPGDSEHLYAFQAGGFYSPSEPPHDLATAQEDRRSLGRLPALVRYEQASEPEGGAVTLRAEVLMHSWLSHTPKELKRLLVAADAMTRALDLGLLTGDATLRSPAGRRGAVLLCLAGLLEYPSDQNRLDGLWSAALQALRLPEISRSVVRACITDADHDQSNYYGSRRGLTQLLESVKKADPVAWAKLESADPAIGRAAELAL